MLTLNTDVKLPKTAHNAQQYYQVDLFPRSKPRYSELHPPSLPCTERLKKRHDRIHLCGKRGRERNVLHLMPAPKGCFSATVTLKTRCSSCLLSPRRPSTVQILTNVVKAEGIKGKKNKKATPTILNGMRLVG